MLHSAFPNQSFESAKVQVETIVVRGMLDGHEGSDKINRLQAYAHDSNYLQQ